MPDKSLGTNKKRNQSSCPLLSELVAHLERIAPLAAAESWDNVGLIAAPHGNPIIKNVLVALDLTRDVLAECRRQKSDILICYHPPVFKPLTKLSPAGDTPESLTLELFRMGVAIYSPHTALDVVDGGTNDALAAALKIKVVGSLTDPRSVEPQFKLVTFVPEGAVEKMATVIFAAGAGCIGKNSRYTCCSFRIPGQGTFRGDQTTHPAVGHKGRLELVPEIRWETLVGQSALTAAIDALKTSHPYEEPAYDVIPLANPVSVPGMGRVGELPQPTELGRLAKTAKRQLGAASVHMAGEVKRVVSTCALLAGSGGRLALDAHRLRPFDVLITGEMKHHDLLAYQAADINVVLLGHATSEAPVLPVLAAMLETQWPTLRVTVSTPGTLTFPV